MICQYCGEIIDYSADNRCQSCGQEIIRSHRGFPWPAFFLLMIMVLVIGGVYGLIQPVTTTNTVQAKVTGRTEAQGAPPLDNVSQVKPESEKLGTAAATDQISLPTSYQLPVKFGNIGPQLLAAGAIDYDRFVQTYERAGQALNEVQLAILAEGDDTPVVIDQDNAYFLLNFLWALGLTNQNTLLDEGPLMQYSAGDIGRFASTGGWTIGKRPAAELYSSTSLISLSAEQQTRLESVAYNVYRPCCNNHTAFADCNHGMAMLGLLELMAGQGASEDEMFEAAKYMNSFWYPQQALETAVFFQATMGLEYDNLEGRMAVGPEVFSGSGFQSVHEWLAGNGQLEQAPNDGGGCSV